MSGAVTPAHQMQHNLVTDEQLADQLSLRQEQHLAQIQLVNDLDKIVNDKQEMLASVKTPPNPSRTSLADHEMMMS